MITRASVLVAIVILAGCGGRSSPVAPSPPTPTPTPREATTALTLRFLHEESFGGGQSLIAGGSVALYRDEVLLMTVAIAFGSGWTTPQVLTVPRGIPLRLRLEYPAWTADHWGPQPAGTADVVLLTADPVEAWYIIVPADGRAAYVGGPIP
jgi:hypothetical protein